MTVLVGVRCTDGVVIGADSAATSAAGQVHLLKMASDKISIIGGRVIVAGTGQLGLGQRFCAIVKEAHDNKVFQRSAVEVGKHLSAAGRNDFAGTGAMTGSYGALVAAPADDHGQLIEFAVPDFQPELKTQKIPFVAMGSGQTLAEPFMSFVYRTFWASKVPDVKSGVFGLFWALSHTLECAPGMVGPPIVLATLQKGGGGWQAKLISDDDLGEQAQHMEAVEQKIAHFRSEIFEGVEAADVPKP